MELVEMIQLCRQRDKLAQDCLFRRYSRYMFNYCRRFIHDDIEAREVMVEGFAKVFLKLNTFEYQNDAAVTVWIQSLMRSECVRRLRDRKFSLKLMEKIPEDSGVYDTNMYNLHLEDIHKLIARLPESCSAVFNLYVLEGCSHAEIAVALDITERHSKRLMNQSRTILLPLFIKNDIRYDK